MNSSAVKHLDMALSLLNLRSYNSLYTHINKTYRIAVTSLLYNNC